MHSVATWQRWYLWSSGTGQSDKNFFNGFVFFLKIIITKILNLYTISPTPIMPKTLGLHFNTYFEITNTTIFIDPLSGKDLRDGGIIKLGIAPCKGEQGEKKNYDR